MNPKQEIIFWLEIFFLLLISFAPICILDSYLDELCFSILIWASWLNFFLTSISWFHWRCSKSLKYFLQTNCIRKIINLIWFCIVVEGISYYLWPLHLFHMFPTEWNLMLCLDNLVVGLAAVFCPSSSHLFRFYWSFSEFLGCSSNRTPTEESQTELETNFSSWNWEKTQLFIFVAFTRTQFFIFVVFTSKQVPCQIGKGSKSHIELICIIVILVVSMINANWSDRNGLPWLFLNWYEIMGYPWVYS